MPLRGIVPLTIRRRLATGGASRRTVVIAVVVGVAIVVGVPAIAIAWNGSAVPQPVQFNHLKHTDELSLDCTFCHAYARTGAHSGLPDAETCSICHSTTQGDSEEAARVTELLEAGDPLRFNKLFRLPDHVFYTHRRHVGVADLPCEGCHGDIATTVEPPARALVQVDMDFCMDCHRAEEASLECNACHR
jgi:hypothetical protein